MSLKLFLIPLITFYLAFRLQQTNATFLVESATGKALIQSACSACDSPPACYAVLNPIANHPNLNPTDICTVAVQAAQNVAKITYGMLNVSATVTLQIARNPAVQQSVRLCAQEYAHVLDLVDKAATALTQKVDEDKVPEFLSTAIAAIAKCDASAVKVANSAVQITTKNVDCSKMLKNALGIYKVFAEYIENPSHDPKEITGSVVGNMGGNFDFNAGFGGGGDGGGDIIGLSVPTGSPTPKGGASTTNNMKFSFAQNGEFRKEFSASGKGNVQFQPKSPSTDSNSDGGSTPSQVNTNMKFEGLGLGFGKRIKGFFNPDSQNPDSGISAGAPQSESSAGAPQTGSTPSKISTNMKYEGLGLGFGKRIKGFLNPDSENLDSGNSAGAPQSGNPPSQISTNMKFEGLGLGFGERIKGFFHQDSGNTDSGSDEGALQSGSSAGAPQTGSPGSHISTNLKFEGLGLGFGQRIKGFFSPDSQNTDSGSSEDELESGSSAGAPQTESPPLKTSTNMKYEGLGLVFGQRIKGFLNPDAQNTESEISVDEPQSGSIAGSPVNTGLKFSLSGFAKSLTSSKKNKEHKGTGSPSPAPANAPSSSGSAKAPSPVDSGASNSNTDDGANSNTDDGANSNTDDGANSNTDDGANSYTDDDVTLNDGNDSPSPSPSGNNAKEVSLKYSLSHLIPDT